MSKNNCVKDNKKLNRFRIGLFTVESIFVKPLIEYAKKTNHKIVVVITSKGPKTRQCDDYLDVAKETPKKTDLIISDNPENFSTFLSPYNIDIILSCGFPYLLRKEVLKLSKIGSINLHNSILPKNRGPNALGWSILNNDLWMGLTAHLMTEKFDSGNIILTKKIKYDINEDISKGFLCSMERYVYPQVEMIFESIQLIGNGYMGYKQEGESSYARKFTTKERIIDWRSRSALYIHNLTRAFYGFRDIPHGTIGIVDNGSDKIKYNFLRSFYDEKSVKSDKNPGEIIKQTENEIIVQCRDIPLRFTKWNKINKEAKEFTRNHERFSQK